MMFIKLGDKRINISLIKEYKPINKTTISGEYFSIGLIFLNDTKEEIHFFSRKDDRDDFLDKLDKNLIQDFS